MNALVLAGGISSQELNAGVNCKALIDIQGRPMLSYVLSALDSSSYIDTVIVVATEQTRCLLDKAKFKWVLATEDIVDNVLSGMEHVSHDESVLLVTSDIPMLTGAAIDDFIEQAAQFPARLHYPIISKETIEMDYPGVRRTYVSLREGTFTGGNIMLMDPSVVADIASLARHVVKNRKKPRELCRMLGLRFLIKLLVGRLSINEVEERVGQIAKVKVKAIHSMHASIGVDVDKPSDLSIINEVMTVQAG